jgi:hypothetical protein
MIAGATTPWLDKAEALQAWACFRGQFKHFFIV